MGTVILQSMNLEQICTNVNNIAKESAQFIKKELDGFNRNTIEVKGLNDFVSYVDKTSEMMLVKELTKLLPDSGFLTEEKTIIKAGKKYEWIIDPLDGTTNFIHGVPCFCISIALACEGSTILGVVHEVTRNETFYSWENVPAFLNSNELQVTQTTKLADSLLATGFPYYDFKWIDNYLNTFKYFMQHTHGIRRMGSAAFDLACVAAGRFDGFFEYSLKPWDVAAGAFLVQQAGGVVCDFQGKQNWLHGQQIVACNKLMFEEFFGVIKNNFEI